jgi:hypothetical protein
MGLGRVAGGIQAQLGGRGQTTALGAEERAMGPRPRHRGLAGRRTLRCGLSARPY